ncbi:MAG: hypothetical protein R2864_08880 [Syntrophotaleaceae bacterium]
MRRYRRPADHGGPILFGDHPKLTMTLASQGLLGFPAAMALVLGENIGTTITAELATIGSSNIDATVLPGPYHVQCHRVGLMLIIFPYFLGFIETITLWSGVGPVDRMIDGEAVHIARYLANGHTLFNITNALVFLLCLRWLVKVAIKLSPKKKAIDEEPPCLNLTTATMKIPSPPWPGPQRNP